MAFVGVNVDMQLGLCACENGWANQTLALKVVAPYVNPAAVSVLSNFCFDIGANANIGRAVTASGCGRNAINSRADQYWKVAGGTIQSLQLDAPLCFAISSSSVAHLADCTSTG